MHQHPLVVVHAESREPQRNGQEARRLGREIETRGVRPAHDVRQLPQTRIVEFVVVEKRVEAAPVATVGEDDTLDVVRRGAPRPGEAENVSSGREQESRVLIDEARNQPWTGHPIDLGTLAGYPAHSFRLLSAGTLCQ